MFNQPPAAWTAGLHHDGSALYVSNPLPAIGETVTIRLRVPADAPIRMIELRTEPDGEGETTPMTRAGITDDDSPYHLYEAQMPVIMPANPYRFEIRTEGEGEYHYNALGVSKAIWPTLFDFVLLADFQRPSWIDDAVFYQIFPDRFHNGDPALNVPDGAFVSRSGKRSQTRDWDAPLRPYAESGNVDFYGGDLPGIIARLDYLRELGVNALYLNPIFASSSSHRYNTEDFYKVDPHLGGDEALAALRKGLDERGMRYILDTTPNHSGDGHHWFKDAQADSEAPTAEYYTFHEHPHDYAFWKMARSLPKLNYASDAVHEVMYRAKDAVLRHWLKPPFRADGWRLDVFNMTARQGAFQQQPAVGRGIRAAVKAENPDAYLMAESFFDASLSLQGDQLDAVMNYVGFTLPLWRWLSQLDDEEQPSPYDAADFAAQAQRFLAAVPWAIASMQFNLLGSHDTARIRSIVGDDTRLVQLAVTLLMTFPGVPCIYYGDEIGMAGGKGPHNRGTMRWNESEWDMALRDWFKQVIALRKESDALKTGGYQLLYASGGLLAYQRQSDSQRLIVVGHRGPAQMMEAVIPVGAGGIRDGVTLRDRLSELTVKVRDGHITLRDLPVGAALVLEEEAL